MYIVLKSFKDLEDGGHKYLMGEEYPRKGYTPTEERIKALSSEDNKACMKLIKEVKATNIEAEDEPKKTTKKTPKKKSGGKKASK